ncbi:MAG: VWA domain-containing protein [Acidobacteriota bacterium]
MKIEHRPNFSRLFATAILFACGAALISGRAAAAQQERTPSEEEAPSSAAFSEQRFSDMISVTEIEVPVRVLIKGKPLLGLTAENFEIYDKGVLRPIVGFRQIDLVEDLRKGIVEASSGQGFAAPTPSDPGRNLMVLVDFAFSRRLRLNVALKGVRKMVETQLDPSDRLAVATYGPISGLNLLVGFTRDREAVELALDAIEGMIDAKRKPQREALQKLHQLRFETPGSNGKVPTIFETLSTELSKTAALAILSGALDYDDPVNEEVLQPEERGYFKAIRVRVEVDRLDPIDIAQDLAIGTEDTSIIRAFGLSMAELGTLLRDIPGQKDILMLSEGFSGPLLRDARSQAFMEEMFRAFRKSNVALYGIDIGGVPGLDDRSFGADSRLFFASATGGDLIENTNDIAVATSRILQRTGVVYLLSFQPEDPQEDPQFRKVEVKLKDAPKGAKLYHRPGYYTQRPAHKREPYEQRIDGAGWLLTNLEARELDVEVYGQSGSSEEGRVRIPLAIEIDGQSLLAIRTKKKSWIEMQAAVVDGSGQVQDMLLGRTKVDFGDMASLFQEGGLRFVSELDLPPGRYELRVLVRSSRKGEVFLAGYPIVAQAGVDPQLAPLPDPQSRLASNWLSVPADNRPVYFQ